MTLSMYQASVPVFIHGLKQLAAILHKAEAHAQARGIDAAVLVNARLYPDMLPLTGQVQLASDYSRGAAARLAGVERPSIADTETTFEDLQARIAKTIAYLETFKPEQIDGSEARDVTVQSRTGNLAFKGQSFLLNFAQPNFYFHVVTAYSILRHNGVELGKRDFTGALPV